MSDPIIPTLQALYDQTYIDAPQVNSPDLGPTAVIQAVARDALNANTTPTPAASLSSEVTVHFPTVPTLSITIETSDRVDQPGSTSSQLPGNLDSTETTKDLLTNTLTEKPLPTNTQNTNTQEPTTQAKFQKFFATVFSFEKGWDKGRILLRVAACFITAITGLFIPLGIWWACSNSSCMNRSVTKS